MAKGTNQKLKMLYLLKILMENTDENHGLSMGEIIEALSGYDIEAERKSLYNDIELLKVYGIDIISDKNGSRYEYRIGAREFELAELKLLVDSVQSAKFITTRKSNELIHKLESLASRYEATQLQRQVYVTDRIKTMNESVYYNIDCIHTAIASNSQITFQYFQWSVQKKMELRKNGELYRVSPWALSCDDENYYLISYDDTEDMIKHFRVDKMLHIKISDDKRQGKDSFKQFNMASYAKKTFGMFGGEEQNVKILCENRFAGVFIDRFGKEISLIPVDEEHFTVTVRVAMSRQFLGWIMSLGEGIRIVSPDNVVEQMQEEIRRLSHDYGV